MAQILVISGKPIPVQPLEVLGPQVLIKLGVLQFVVNSLPSFLSRVLSTLQYLLAD